MSLDSNKVVVAMSGGVDSTVTAHLLIEAGYECVGAFLHHCQGGKLAGMMADGCGSSRDAADGRAMAEKLGIPFEELDVSEPFVPILEDFASQYAAGRTPNPCVHCNALIKFGALMDFADRIGAAHLATGHYVRRTVIDGKPAFCRGAAGGKDQSYVLFEIARDKLGRIMTPLGEMGDKAQVRAIAQSLGLEVHDKPDSQDICFAGPEGFRAILETFAPEALTAGAIVDTSGKVLGEHEGYGMYTIGQRKGLGVAAGVPVYVSAIDPASATVTLGEREAVMHRHLSADHVNWHTDVADEFRAIVQVRYNHRGAPGTVRLRNDGFEVEFDEPVWAITPGQAAAVYDGDRLLGGGWIRSYDN
jgi:tRNA-specific 2-thiouridylase